MGKKGEKLKNAAPASANSKGDDSSTPEPYACTGNFPDDFAELWQRCCHEKDFMPIVRTRGRPPTPPQPDDPKTLQQGEEEETLTDGDPPPTTYSVMEKSIYFRPTIQCDYEVEETKQLQINHVLQIYIRGWKVEEKLITVLKLCALDKLNTINFWHTGLTDHTFRLFVALLPSIPSVKTVVIEGNAMPGSEPFAELLNKDIQIQHLSLRNNEITDLGAAKIGKALGSATSHTPEICTLNLAFNQISDEGAKCIAEGLRMNRVLASLSLASNKISDVGAEAIASCLQRFTLTHDEVVQRRKMMSERGMSGRGSLSPGMLRRGDSKDRPSSNRSGSVFDKARAARVPSKKKDAAKGPEKAGKRDEGKSKKELSKLQSKVSVAEAPKSRGKRSGGKDSKRGNAPDVDSPDIFEQTHPLLDPGILHKQQKVFAPGCFTLLALNLSRNQIGLHGMKSLLHAIKHQAKRKERENLSPLAPGLLRLSVQKNRISHDSDTYLEIQEIVNDRDPIKPESKSPEDDFQSVAG